MKRVLFIDRDGTVIKEAPPTYQVDSFEKLEFYPDVFQYLSRIANELDFELVMITNQDGLGTPDFAEDQFWPVHQHIIKSLENEGISFSATFIDRSYPHENSPNRKPGIGMLMQYINNPGYDLAGSFVIGDRITDVQLAKNLGCKAIWLNADPTLGGAEIIHSREELEEIVALETVEWCRVYEFLKLGSRHIEHERSTNETSIRVSLDLDGAGHSKIQTGLGFFDHMLEQLAKHARIELAIDARGDLHIDEHHTIEDTAIALGEAFGIALSNKAGLERYGFGLPMDEASAKVLIDFGGRPWLVWNVSFKRERIGEVPTEMFHHFFKSFSDAARCNLHISCEGENEHHKIEAIFKAFAKAIRMAIRRDPLSNHLPTTKGIL
jgi:imidazoleglycerol-phosphate dehydratase/histidinol-phosphatase